MALKSAEEYRKLAGGDANKALSLMMEDMRVLDTAKTAAEHKAAGMSAKLTFRVSTKGAVSVYGNGRWPTTLYREQWERLLAEKDAILAFITANAKTLKVKGDATADNDTPEAKTA